MPATGNLQPEGSATKATSHGENEQEATEVLSSSGTALTTQDVPSATSTASMVPRSPTRTAATTSSLRFTPPGSPIAPITSVTFTISPHRMFFGIHELVAEVVGYVSARNDLVNCLYVSKTFYAAAVPLVYKYIPFESLDVVDPVLKERHLRTVILPEAEWCTNRMLELSTAYSLYCEPSDDPVSGHTSGWVSISKRRTREILHFSGDEHDYAHELLSLSEDDFGSPIIRFTPSTSDTLTLVFVPPYISSQKPDAVSFYPFRFAVTALDFWLLRKMRSLQLGGPIEIVGLDFHDPFSKSSSWNAIDLKPSFLKALQNYSGNVTLPFDGLNDIYPHIKYVTFKDYLETTGEWKNVLDWRRVGEWLNKYDEREAQESSLGTKSTKVKTKPHAGSPWRTCENIKPLEHLPRCTIDRWPPSEDEGSENESRSDGGNEGSDQGAAYVPWVPRRLRTRVGY